MILEYTYEKHVAFKQEESMQEGIQKGIQKGCAITLERVNKLVNMLISQNRIEDVKKSVTDKEYQNQLFEEFGL